MMGSPDERLASWLAGRGSILRRDAQRLGPIRDPAAFDAALSILARLDRVQLVADGRKRLVRVTGPSVASVAAESAPGSSVATVASVATRSVATGHARQVSQRGSVATVAAGASVAMPASPCVPTAAVLFEPDREWFEERAAIMEFDGGLMRDRAEAEAQRLMAARP